MGLSQVLRVLVNPHWPEASSSARVSSTAPVNLIGKILGFSKRNVAKNLFEEDSGSYIFIRHSFWKCLMSVFY